MDASTSELLNKRNANTPRKKIVKKRGASPAARKKMQRRRKIRLREREVLKAGMTSSLTVAILTGIKVIKPMRLHPVAGWFFLGFTIAHLISNSRSGSKS
ncbi:MAG: hypothetical protein HQL53_04570 [Magnetococcales bacterium]|nr:hypothetical protein [Magnetococcales bacterium]